jgi:hypothetical protein
MSSGKPVTRFRMADPIEQTKPLPVMLRAMIHPVQQLSAIEQGTACRSFASA